MVCLLQLSEQLHSSRWVQAQVRAVLICDITTALRWELIPNAPKKQLPGAAIRLERRGEEPYAESHSFMCSHVARPFFGAFRAASLTSVKCKRFSSQMLLHVRQMIVFRTLLWSLQSGSSKQMYWTQTGEAIRHAHFHTRKIKKSARPGKRTSRHLPFVSETIQSVVWLPFASNITTAESKRNE